MAKTAKKQDIAQPYNEMIDEEIELKDGKIPNLRTNLDSAEKRVEKLNRLNNELDEVD